MPELPEVETVRAGLAAHVVGRTVAGAEVRHPRAVRHHVGGGADLAARLAGRTITAAVRRGKYLWLDLDGAGDALLAHLGMSGQLLVTRPDGAAPAEAVGPVPTMVRPVSAGDAHLRVRVDFTDGARLSFVDQRTFGHVLLTDLVPTPDGGPGGHGSAVPALPAPVAHIARDLLDPALDRAAASRRLRTRRTEVKRALLDQTLVSGVGNIYADEALWRAALHPRRPTDRLRPATVRELFDAAEAVMRDALAAGGTSFDALYVDVEGASGYFARSLDAYGRAGLPCRRCGALMVREHFMNRSSTLCPRCQRPPRGSAP
ncbi:bifunctional DNA-formamidopyrimidine glycosylase/DNA-(apurinic or apyrimidinic site) lyase [Georgenia faecalis]|uniref:bifunctional DNA-formamidopyrimidine glycosylase/DNA-(apurinic or apyrimidinic site) lyase n=1 Tax=Georgenia faecalis TaxID=2483799 RepID=UPI000FDBBC54|nr:bifunctional DNA-formamidopyrimidine glycosylase/DNA-(apurinic or apyrimidinic site) lyase [Georgenia faecalis]